MALRVQDARDYVGVDDGDAITVANSEQVGSTKLSEVSATVGNTITLDTTEPALEVVGVSGGIARIGWTDLGASDTFTCRLEGKGFAGISGTPRVIDVRTAADGGIARLEVDTNRRVGMYAGSTQVDYSAVGEALPVSAGWRLELTGQLTGGKCRGALYVDSDGKGTSPLWDSGELTGLAMGSVGASWARAGKLNTSHAATFGIRNFSADTTYGLLGPLLLNKPIGLSWNGGTLSWSAVSGATSYEVERDGVVVATGITGTSWVDTSASSGVARRYRVRAIALLTLTAGFVLGSAILGSSSLA